MAVAGCFSYNIAILQSLTVSATNNFIESFALFMLDGQVEAALVSGLLIAHCKGLEVHRLRDSCWQTRGKHLARRSRVSGTECKNVSGLLEYCLYASLVFGCVLHCKDLGHCCGIELIDGITPRRSSENYSYVEIYVPQQIPGGVYFLFVRI